MHYVFDLQFADGREAVLRIADPANVTKLQGAVYWSKMLRPHGVPLPEILHADLSGERSPFPFIALERLPGTDLLHVYNTIGPVGRRNFAATLAAIQANVVALPPGCGYGYAGSFDGPLRHQSWTQVISRSLAAAR